MIQANRTARRQTLLDAVKSIREILRDHADAAEREATLSPAAVDALRQAGIFRLKVPVELGGDEADPMTQMEVIEALTYIHPASGWCTMIGAASVGVLGAYLPEAGVERVFAGGQIPVAASSFFPAGVAKPVEGGYRVSGRWRFASGIRHSEWVWASAVVVREGAQPSSNGMPPETIFITLPTSDIEIHDNWQVMGLRGTGSCDFSVVDQFVPQSLTFQLDRPVPGDH